MGERQARHLLAPARPDIGLAPHHLHGHGAAAGGDIQAHHGQPFYRKMAYLYINHRGKTKSLQFKFSIQPDGSAPSWNPSQAGTGNPCHRLIKGAAAREAPAIVHLFRCPLDG